LQRAGIDTTIYAERTPDDVHRTRLPNSVVRFAPAVAREHALGVDHWIQAGSDIDAIHFSVLDTPIARPDDPDAAHFGPMPCHGGVMFAVISYFRRSSAARA
jgi:hypothetical protein